MDYQSTAARNHNLTVVSNKVNSGVERSRNYSVKGNNTSYIRVTRESEFVSVSYIDTKAYRAFVNDLLTEA